MKSTSWSVGDWMICRKSKRSTSPGPRAQNISASNKGESYTYTVDKYWVVVKVDGEQLVVQTRGGKQHERTAGDSDLRKPRFWERWLLRERFRSIEEAIASSDATLANSSDSA